MNIRLNRAHYPVTALGWGRRIGLWVQGCGIGCPGCVARDTWDPDPATRVPVEAVLAWCRSREAFGVDGVTISGGEPFEQPEALLALLEGFRRWRESMSHPLDLLCYSGFPLGRLRRDHGVLLELLDAIIPEPFVTSRPRAGPWRGSDNQPLVPLSPLGEVRYGLAAGRPHPEPRLQLGVIDGRVYLIGIPGRKEIRRLEEHLARQGLRLDDASWTH